MCRTAERQGKQTFKESILQVCQSRNDDWSVQVEVRLSGVISDLHAADARYHDACRKTFMGLRNVEFAAKRKTTTDDPSLQATIRCMENDKSKTWTSVELHSFYTGNGGSLPRKTLVQKLSDVFGDELLVLSSKGLANIVIFRNKASTLLRLDDLDEDAIPIEYTAKQIVSECKKIHYNKDKYNIRIDRKLAAEQSSATLSKLLS